MTPATPNTAAPVAAPASGGNLFGAGPVVTSPAPPVAPAVIPVQIFGHCGYLTTLAEAQAVAAQLQGIGGGVLPYNPDTAVDTSVPGTNTDPKRSGIYIAAYPPGPVATPDVNGRLPYCLRFQNGAEGFSAGLIAGEINSFPVRWPLMLSLEVNAEAKSIL